MRVLGVDPGLTRCGVGVVEGEPGRMCRLITVDVVTSDPELELSLRLLGLDRALAALVEEFRPDAVAVERVFSQHNVRTVMGTAQAGAVAVLAAARAGLPVQLYTPSEVKAAVTGSGQADKAQVTTMVTRLLRLDAPPRPADAADALALAICHVWRGGAQAKIAAARSAATHAVRSAQTAQRALAAERARRLPSPGTQTSGSSQSGLRHSAAEREIMAVRLRALQAAEVSAQVAVIAAGAAQVATAAAYRPQPDGAADDNSNTQASSAQTSKTDLTKTDVSNTDVSNTDAADTDASKTDAEPTHGGHT